MQTRNLLTILKLLEKKYPDEPALVLYSDGSGRIIRNPEEYGLNPIYNDPEGLILDFNNLDDLVEHLKS